MSDPASDSKPLRLQVFLARATGLSRRRAEDEIRAGKVFVDGVRAELGAKVPPDCQDVHWKGASVSPASDPVQWLALHKPKGVLSTRKDDRGRPTVMDYLPRGCPPLFPVGRLDADSTGLILMTNDGPLSHRLIHPSFHLSKLYLVRSDRPLPRRALEVFQEGGLEMDDSFLQPVGLEVRGKDLYELELFEGKNRQIRRMFEAFGCSVKNLKRIRFGPLELGSLAKGSCRRLKGREVDSLRKAVTLGHQHPAKRLRDSDPGGES